MKKSLLALCAIALVLVSCNQNPKDEPDSGKGRTDISSILTIGQTAYLDSLEYDGSGRVVKALTFAVEDEELADLLGTVSYTYSDGSIERSVSGAKTVYTIGKDKLITKFSIGDRSVDLEYDSDGHLVKCGDITYTWKDGDIAVTSEGYAYTYSNVENPGYWPEEFPGTDKWLYRKGLFGKLPKHLPASWKMEDKANSVSHQFSCEYELDGGALVECDMTAIHTTGSTPSISEYRITINWKKY